jgi:biopolymer transport protein ExbD
MAGGINRRPEGDETEELHEINVVPFIDVMLVLLVIFMVAAPLATVDVPVDLPASTAEARPRPEAPLYVTLKDDLTLAIGAQAVARSGLAAALDAAAGGDRETRVFLRADRSAPYGEVMALMNDLRAAGYLKLALVGLETAGGGLAAPVAPGGAAEAAAGPAGGE